MPRQTESKNGKALEQPESQQEKGSPPRWSRKMWTGTGTVQASVFSKMVGEGDQQYEAFNVTLRRTYKDGDQFKTVQGFRTEDVPVAIQLLQSAYDFITAETNRE